MGIKSFQGKRDASQGKEEEQILVSDYMTTKLITFKADDSLDHVINLLIKNKILLYNPWLINHTQAANIFIIYHFYIHKVIIMSK